MASFGAPLHFMAGEKMHINPVLVASTLVQKLMPMYRQVDFQITSGSLLQLPDGSPSCVELEVTTKKARVTVRIFSNCTVQVGALPGKGDQELWNMMQLHLRGIMGLPGTGPIIYKG